MRVVIAEDEVLLRQGLRLLLEEGEFDVVAAVGDGDELMTAVGAHRPDLVITDIRMPPSNNDEGLRAARRIREQYPDTAIVVLSQYVQRRYAIELLDGRAARVGYLLKQRIADITAFRDDLHRVVDGGTALDPEIVAVLMSRAGRGAGVVRELTPRQREVLAYMAEGRSNAWIGQKLVLTEKAIVQHTSNIYDALGLPVAADDHRRVLAVIRYLDGVAG
ncbi:response regulator transcription factor [Agromyces cerinus]|uniref:Two component transcriptional regulator, LuxR family n=1 Tax=Agromyces cerinus subsp. cerinus TaxID=232089 RepID=A0A1N6GAT4_9MICO|nr:response regulator transcription factor [Agromyces cerinus]SIO04618.1 two component transcriptional regulator, LuxR family [Agromyces cerinus subsp. cerinus]